MEQPSNQSQTHQNEHNNNDSEKQDHQKPPIIKNNNLTKSNNNKKPIWDCGSTLYDSLELSTFQKQLDSAIINSSRTHSMPHLPSQQRRAPPSQPQPQPQPQPQSKKHHHVASKVSRSIQKLLRSVFRASKPKNSKQPNYDSSFSSSPDPWFMDPQPITAQQENDNNNKVVDVDGGGKYFVVYEKSNGLTTIPEVPEVGISPDIRSLVKKTMSDRFTPSAGIYCL